MRCFPMKNGLRIEVKAFIEIIKKRKVGTQSSIKFLSEPHHL